MAPTGTISLMMDCDTTGIEPAYALAYPKRFAEGEARLTCTAVLDGSSVGVGWEGQGLASSASSPRCSSHSHRGTAVRVASMASIQPSAAAFSSPTCHTPPWQTSCVRAWAAALETPLDAVARIMATHRVHSVVTAGVETDDVHGGRLVWKLISDDVLTRAVSESNEGQTAADVATTEAVTVAPTEPLRSAARLIAEHRTSHLVVSSETTRTPVGSSTAQLLASAGGHWGLWPGLAWSM